MGMPEELLKGLTDLPVAIVAIICGLLLYNKKDKEHHDSGMFFLVAFCAIFGIVVHSFKMSTKLNAILWGILYLFLYELVGTFSVELVKLCTGKDVKAKGFIHLLEVICCIASWVCLYKANDIDIYIFVFFAAVALIDCLIDIKRQGKFNILAIFLFIFAILAMLAQGLKTIIPHGVAIGHIFLIFAEIMLFLLAKKHKKRL